MKKLTLLVAAAVALFVSAVLAWPVARSGPEPIEYGRDACAHCRMHLSQPGFAAEGRDERGRLLKFDDVGCLVAHVREGTPLAETWVEDHASRELVPLADTTFVQGDGLPTPMASGVVGFRDARAAADFARARGARRVTFQELFGRARPDR